MIVSLPDGVLPDHLLRDLHHQGAIIASAPLADTQIQPASLDLRLGDYAYRVRASFLPGKESSVARKFEFTRRRLWVSQSQKFDRAD